MSNGQLPATTAPNPDVAAVSEAAANREVAAPPPRASGHYLATRDQGHRPAGSRALSLAQQAEIDDLVRRSDARTPGSKRLAQLWRPRLADNRAIVGFDPAWKELVYQVVSERSKGSRIWDVDGNEYIDTALGFGTNLFGHSPDFVVSAVREQLERGYAVGVQSDLLGEVAELACSMTGNDRLAFTTSGGEAVETAIRVARTVSGRDRIAYFTDDIHGRSDIVLGRAVDVRGELRTVPMVAGVPQRVVDDAFVLEYGSDRALDVIREHASELALVLVEPVRSRNPDLQPVAFLRELRQLADDHGFVLVFDEIVTGFRAHQRGVQGLLDVRADLTTYGKVLRRRPPDRRRGRGQPVHRRHRRRGVVVRRRQLPRGRHHGIRRNDDQARPHARRLARRADAPSGGGPGPAGGSQPAHGRGRRSDQRRVRERRPAHSRRALQLVLPSDLPRVHAVRRLVPVLPAGAGDPLEPPVAFVSLDGAHRRGYRSRGRRLRCGGTQRWAAMASWAAISPRARPSRRWRNARLPRHPCPCCPTSLASSSSAARRSRPLEPGRAAQAVRGARPASWCARSSSA